MLQLIVSNSLLPILKPLDFTKPLLITEQPQPSSLLEQ